ncbi:MAG: cysteine--tRNA ligase [Candidatus Margulisiibacteriota bacterium]
MALQVYNTISREKEVFEPRDPHDVSMYVCGITPYDETHLGHGRAYVAFDIIRRYLEYSGYKVKYVQNITDIDDKIIKKAADLEKTTDEIAEIYSKSFFDVMDKLKVKKASYYPKATEHIKEMVDFISGLEKNGFAYVSGGDVYFDISKYKDYGRLSKRDIDGMLSGARVEVNDKKKNPLDFVLWKAAKEGEPSWESPWGTGRPGWHTECVVMSKKHLGIPIDIHGGGADLMFPHHENEIAQAQCCGPKPFVKYWMHNGFITINKEKMSKSLGNFFTVDEIFKKYDPMVVRYFLLRTHYRSPVNFSFDDLDEARAALDGIKNAYDDMQFMLKSSKNDKTEADIDLKYYKEKFIEAMDDDFNTSSALAVIFDLIKNYHEHKFKLTGEQTSNAKNLLEEFNVVLQLGLKESKVEIKQDAHKLLEKRNEARRTKDFSLADKYRADIEAMGYTIDDTPFGSFVKKKVADPPALSAANVFGFGKKG